MIQCPERQAARHHSSHTADPCPVQTTSARGRRPGRVCRALVSVLFLPAVAIADCAHPKVTSSNRAPKHFSSVDRHKARASTLQTSRAHSRVARGLAKKTV